MQATYLITYPASSHILPLRVDTSISIKSFSIQIKAKPQTSIVHNGLKTHNLCSFPFCTTSKLQIQKPSRQEEKHYPNPIFWKVHIHIHVFFTLFLPTWWCFLKRNCPNPTFWKAPHSHPCLLLLPHSIPSYMVMFPEEKLSKSCIQEALNSQPCLLLLAHSIPHYRWCFPEEKPSKSCILEGSTFTTMSFSFSLYSLLHGGASSPLGNLVGVCVGAGGRQQIQ